MYIAWLPHTTFHIWQWQCPPFLSSAFWLSSMSWNSGRRSRWLLSCSAGMGGRGPPPLPSLCGLPPATLATERTLDAMGLNNTVSNKHCAMNIGTGVTMYSSKDRKEQTYLGSMLYKNTRRFNVTCRWTKALSRVPELCRDAGTGPGHWVAALPCPLALRSSVGVFIWAPAGP